MRHHPLGCAPASGSRVNAASQHIILTLAAAAWLAPLVAVGCSRAPAYQSMTLVELEKMLAAPEPAHRVQGAFALGEMGADANSAVPGLAALLDDQNLRVRQTAAVALGKIGPSAAAAAPALAQGLNDADVVMRRHCAAALGRIGAAARPALPALRKSQRDSARIVREAATEAIKQIETPPAPRSAA